MDIVLHNPHVLFFKETIPGVLSSTKSFGKFDYLFDYLYHKNKKLTVLINDSGSTPIFHGSLKILNSPIIQFYFWVFLNRLNPFRFKIYFNAKKIDYSNVIFSFIYGHLTFVKKELVNAQSWVEELQKSKALKVIHLSHYGYHASIGSKNLFESNIDILISENNLTKNCRFFNFHFNWYKKDVYTLPFVPQRRFTLKTDFKDRINKALSTGANTYEMDDENFISFFKDNKLQPLRGIIMNQLDTLNLYIDSIISNVGSHGANSRVKSVKKNTSNKIITNSKNILKYFLVDPYLLLIIIYKIFRKGKIMLKKGQEYYKIDIVEKYNQYKMFIVPEEVIGLPGIGFVEGMACGCAYIGLNDPMYTDIGLIDKENYIAYNGSLNDLVAKISYYQKNTEALERIAINGYNYVKQNFNGDKVAEDFINYLELNRK